jgi:preprotein translocase subunit SecE
MYDPGRGNAMAKSVAVVEPNAGLERLKSAPERLSEFLKDVRAEMKKVVTPSAEEVKTTTFVVILTTFLFAGYFAIVDGIVGHIIDFIFKHLAVPQ